MGKVRANVPMQPDEREIIGSTRDLLAQLAEDRRKAKAKEESEAWTKPAAVSLVVIAVLAATAVQRGGSFGTRQTKHINSSIYDQVTASDHWSLYQSRSTKAHVYELGVDLAKGLAATPEVEAKMEASLGGKAKKYEDEKKLAMEDAHKAERHRDLERTLADANAGAGAKMGQAILAFQAAVAISSIGLVMKKKPLWWVSLVLGLGATAWMLIVLFHFAPAS